MKYFQMQSLSDARELVRLRMTVLEMSANRVEVVAGVPEGTVRRLLAPGDNGCAVDSLLSIMRAVGVAVATGVVPRYEPPPLQTPGRKPAEK